jgi:hypothetical protein
MKKGLWLIIIWLVIPTLLVTSCTGEKTKNTILEVTVSGLSIICPVAVPPQLQYKTARMYFKFKIHNPNVDAAVTLDKFEYGVYGDEYAVAGPETIVLGESFNLTIEPSGDAELSSPLPYISKDDFPALWSEMAKGNVTWRIEGTAYIKTSVESLSVPFQCTVKDYSINMDERCLEGE